MVEFLTPYELKEYLLTIRHAMPCTFLAETTPDMNKTGNPYWGRVTKKVNINVFVGFNYGKSVNRQRSKEGLLADFIPRPRKWGERIYPTPVIYHKQKWYMETRFLHDVWPTFFIDGKYVSYNIIKPYLNDVHIPYNQGVKKPIFCRDYSLESIKEININGHEFVIGTHPENEDVYS